MGQWDTERFVATPSTTRLGSRRAGTRTRAVGAWSYVGMPTTWAGELKQVTLSKAPDDETLLQLKGQSSFLPQPGGWNF